MLQQTVTTTVIPYFNRWMEIYPDIESLSHETEQNILRMWEGLGYYSRARNILKTARILVEKWNSKLPLTYRDLIKLPGIGDYTASAILSISCGLSYPVLDANVKRIYLRLISQYEWDKEIEKRCRGALKEIIRLCEPGQFNAAMMQLGQIVCKPLSPRCDNCPLTHHCMAYKKGTALDIPRKKKRVITEKKTSLYGYVQQGKIFFYKPGEGLFREMWILPPEDCVDSKIRIASLPERVHHYTRYKDTLKPVLFRIEDPSLLDSMKGSWFTPEELSHIPVPSVYRKIIRDIQKVLHQNTH